MESLVPGHWVVRNLPPPGEPPPPPSGEPPPGPWPEPPPPPPRVVTVFIDVTFAAFAGSPPPSRVKTVFDVAHLPGFNDVSWRASMMPPGGLRAPAPSPSRRVAIPLLVPPGPETLNFDFKHWVLLPHCENLCRYFTVPPPAPTEPTEPSTETELELEPLEPRLLSFNEDWFEYSKARKWQ